MAGHERHRDADRTDAKTERAVGLVMLALGVAVALGAGCELLGLYEPSDPGNVAIALAGFSTCVMWWVAIVKQRLAGALGSRALALDAAQSWACWALSLVTVVGALLERAFAWWWADVGAGVGIAAFLAYEGWLAIRVRAAAKREPLPSV